MVCRIRFWLLYRAARDLNYRFHSDRSNCRSHLCPDRWCSDGNNFGRSYFRVSHIHVRERTVLPCPDRGWFYIRLYWTALFSIQNWGVGMGLTGGVSAHRHIDLEERRISPLLARRVEQLFWIAMRSIRM